MPQRQASNKAPTVGIIGGLGPAATCALYHHVIVNTPARRDQDHLHVIIDSDPSTPDRTEALLGRCESPLPWLVRSARMLESAGASLLAMPCVTGHAFIDDIRKAVSVQVLSMVDQTAKALNREHPEVDTVGLLATDGTLQADVFAPLRSRYTLLLPEDDNQRQVMSAVYGPSGVKTVGANSTAAQMLRRVAEGLIAHGAEAIIAGCTEIPLVLRREDLAVPLLDTLEVLAQAIIRTALLPQR